MEILLKEEVIDFGNKLILLTDNEDSKLMIENQINKLSIYEILLFIQFLDKKKIDFYINDFIKKFHIEDNEKNKTYIEDKINHFIDIQDIIIYSLVETN